jgi:tRNA(Ser,Leu) C12 N-acetylase TAN1
MIGSMFVVTCSAGFEREAREEIERIVPGSKVRNLFLKGNLIAKTDQNLKDVVVAFKDKKTLYLGRVFPVDIKIEISDDKDAISKFQESILCLDKLKHGDSFLVRCQRRGSHGFTSMDVEKELGAYIENATGAIVNFKDPCKFVVIQIFQNIAYVGVTEASNVITKSIRIFRKYAKGERPLTRAEHKIKEAIKLFRFKISSDFNVLDIGAAPGSWTRVIAGFARRVVAVDPANLDPVVASLPNVVHLRCKAEEIPINIGDFDLITNDMNIDPKKSARIMVDLINRLKEDGLALMAVKFVTSNRKRHVNETMKILNERYCKFKVRRLPHDRRETTLFMQKA